MDGQSILWYWDVGQGMDDCVLRTQTWTTQPGSYALLLELAEPARIAIGRLGMFDFPAGGYVYTGSAHGAGGLAARVGRHLRGGGALRWHVDYLRVHTAARGVVGAAGRLECIWAQRLVAQGGRVIAAGFGASDCRAGCRAHLVYFAGGIEAAELHSLLGYSSSG